MYSKVHYDLRRWEHVQLSNRIGRIGRIARVGGHRPENFLLGRKFATEEPEVCKDIVFVFFWGLEILLARTASGGGVEER